MLSQVQCKLKSCGICGMSADSTVFRADSARNRGVVVKSLGCVGCMMSFGGSWGIVSLGWYEMNGYRPRGVAVGGWSFVMQW